MKKLVSLVTVIFLITTMFTSCTHQGSNNKEVSNSSYNLSSSSNIKFQYFFRGFITLKQNQTENYPHHTYIIETNEDWHDFMDKYVPGTQYYTSVDYSKECLVFSVLFPPQSIYSIGADIKTFIVNENRLVPEYLKNSVTGISNGIYAQNIDDIVHCFVNIVKINKKDIPKGIKNIYHRKK